MRSATSPWQILVATVFAVLLTAPAWTRGQQPPPRAPAGAKPTGTATVRGTVVGPEGGGLRDAQVRLLDATTKLSTQTRSDEQGNFEFKGISAGRYSLTVTLDGYISGSWGQKTAKDPASQLAITDGQVALVGNIKVWRPGVISGRVTDDRGEPVSGVMLTALSADYTFGTRKLKPTRGGFVTSDDRGEFRVFNLAPGTYFLDARKSTPTLMGQIGKQTGFIRTFYPGVTAASEADPIKVDIGETQNVHFALRRGKLASIKGSIPDGGAGTHQISVREVDSSFSSSSVFQGSQFYILGLAPGAYQLLMNTGPIGERPVRTADVLGALVQINAGAEDVEGVVLRPIRSAAVTGKLVLENVPTDLVSKFIGSTPKVAAVPTSAPPGPTSPGAVGPSLSFETRTWPGLSFLQLYSSVPELVLRKVSQNGRDITDVGLRTTDGEDVTNIVITVGLRQRVSGKVSGDAGGMPNQLVVIFPTLESRWTIPRYLAAARTDLNGEFAVPNLPAGEYFAVARSSVLPSDWMDPKQLRSLTSEGKRFRVEAGVDITVDLRISR